MNKKGFTLVELLATIVVLAIIISIVITTVSNIMDTSKKKAAEATAYAIIRSSAIYSLDNNYFESIDVLDSRLEYDGMKPDAGSVQTNEDGETKIAISLNGWCVTKDYGSDEVTSIKANTCNYTLSDVILTVELNGGETTQPFESTYSQGSTITLTNPTKDGYIFKGWVVVKGNSTINGSTLKIGYKTTIIYAMWEKAVALTINLDGGESSQTLDSMYLTGSIITLENPTRTGYMFSGWEKVSGNSVLSGNSLTIGTSDTVVRATWVREYTITYTNITGNYPTTLLENETLEIDFNGTLYGVLKIYKDGNQLLPLLNYTYDDMILTIPNVDGNIEIVSTGSMCLDNNITDLGDCLLAMDQYTTSVATAKTGIASKGTPDFNLTEPQIEYERNITYGLTSTNIASTTSEAVLFTTTEPTFDSEKGTYALSNTVAGKLSSYISNASTKYYTCLNTSSSCATMYVVYDYRTSTNATTGAITYYATNADKYSYKVTGSSVSNPGLYKAIDDYGDTYYYRGDVRNNWVSFGGFLWRIVRINGDGSIRMIYSGLESATSHTGTNAQIRNSSNGTTSAYGDTRSFTTTTTDITGLTNDTITTTYSNGRYGTTYVGYMYNPEKEIATYPNKELGNTSTTKLNYFPTFTNFTGTSNYYFFKNFDPETDCFIGSDRDESGACTLKCESLGDDCVRSTWRDLADGNYTVNGTGTYKSGSTAYYPYQTDGYKYTCWSYGTAVTHSNSNGTTSVYITCPIVSNIIGVSYNTSTNKLNETSAKVKYTGLFSKITDENNRPSESNKNIKDSNIKAQVDYWYASNILNKNDGNGNSLESYLSDEIFCNDRSGSNTFPLTASGGSYIYNPYTRNYSNKTPSFECSNISNDGFTLTIDENDIKSTVTPANIGNKKLTYPVGLLTLDDAVFAGARYNTKNSMYYLYTGNTYWTMSPSNFNSHYARANVWTVSSAGNVNFNNTSSGYGVRPVINLKSDVLLSSGIGTESNPFVISLNEGE